MDAAPDIIAESPAIPRPQDVAGLRVAPALSLSVNRKAFTSIFRQQDGWTETCNSLSKPIETHIIDRDPT